MKFMPWKPEPGLNCNENYLIFRWIGRGKILFSATRQGNAIVAHFLSDKIGLRNLKQSFNEFVDFIFDCFDWCEMVIANVNEKMSIVRVLKKCGFREVLQYADSTIMARLKKWE